MRTREKSESTSGAGKRRPIKFECDFEFLKPYVKYYDQIQNSSLVGNCENTAAVEESNGTAESNLKQEMYSEDIEFDEFTAAHTPYETLIQSSKLTGDVTPTVADILQHYLEAKSKKEKDPIDAFFLAMAASVKRLPKKLQLQVKQKVFNAVTDAEMKVLNQGSY